MMIDGVFRGAMDAAMGILERTRQQLQMLGCPPPSGPFNFHLRDLGNDVEKSFLQNFPTGHAKIDRGTDHVYVVGLTTPTPENFAALCGAFSKARAEDTEKKTAFCRQIEEHASPQVMYVGRSRKLRSRVAQHLDDKQGRTYAMHMGAWAQSLDLEIFISDITFSGASDTLVQAVEDGLWSALEPALGKRGPR